MAKLLTKIASGGVIRERIEEQDSVEGFDSLTMRRTVRASSAAAARELISLGSTAAGYGNMYCVDRRASPLVCGIYETEHFFRGIINGAKPYKVRTRGYVESQSANPANYPGGTNVSLQSHQPLVGLTLSYLATTLPTLADTGTNDTPPVSVTPPDNIWDTIADPIHVYPYGWVLDAREYETIPGTTIALVTDQYTYYQRYKPGG